MASNQHSTVAPAENGPHCWHVLGETRDSQDSHPERASKKKSLSSQTKAHRSALLEQQRQQQQHYASWLGSRQAAYYYQQANTMYVSNGLNDILKGRMAKDEPHFQPVPNSTAKAHEALETLAKQFEVHYESFMDAFKSASQNRNKDEDGSENEAGLKNRLCFFGNPLYGSRLCQNSVGNAGQAKEKDNGSFPDPRQSVFHNDRAETGCHNASKPSKANEDGTYQCAGCGDHAQLVCSRCRNVWYCSETCQVRFLRISGCFESRSYWLD